MTEQAPDETLTDNRARVILLGSVFVVAACGLVYELVAGAIGSYLLGDAVTQFSLVIGVFLSAMGLGSWLSRYIKTELLRWFVTLEVWLGLIGGASGVLLFGVSALAPSIFVVVFYGTCIGIGTMVGLEVPLLVRILRERRNLDAALSDTLALDYVGALAGSLAFPLLALPWLGLSRSSIVFGFLNLAVAAIGLTLVRGSKRRLIIWIGSATAALIALFATSTQLVGLFEDLHYQDNVVYVKSSPYQRIVLTRWHSDVRMYLNGHLQFSAVDEARYHEALVVPVMESVPTRRRVLLLGGGDGLAVQRILQWPDVQEITVIDLDPAVVQLAKHRPELLQLNGDALSDKKVHVVHDDAMTWLDHSEGVWDVIIIDLPDPNSPSLAKLYSTAFYALVARHLSAEGAMVTQATSPYFARDAYWCIHDTIGASVKTGAPLRPVGYHINVPSFGEWGFVLASRRQLVPEGLTPSIPTKVLTPQTLRAMFSFSKDLQRPPNLKINRLDDPVLHMYHMRGWQRFNN
ncbi:MAG: spermidine synthase [Kiritimatiellia bacterium]|jgi:spermidine synthase